MLAFRVAFIQDGVAPVVVSAASACVKKGHVAAASSDDPLDQLLMRPAIADVEGADILGEVAAVLGGVALEDEEAIMAFSEEGMVSDGAENEEEEDEFGELGELFPDDDDDAPREPDNLVALMARLKLDHKPSLGIPRNVYSKDTGDHLGRFYVMWGKTIKAVCRRHRSCSLMFQAAWYGGHAEATNVAYRWLAMGKFASHVEHGNESARLAQEGRERARS